MAPTIATVTVPATSAVPTTSAPAKAVASPPSATAAAASFLPSICGLDLLQPTSFSKTTTKEELQRSEERQRLEEEIGTQVATGAALGSFVMGLHLATAHGLGTATPELLALLSSATAAAGSAGCLWSLAERGSTTDADARGHLRPDGIWRSSAGVAGTAQLLGEDPSKLVELPRWSTSVLASLCGLIAPLALIPVSKAAAAGVSSKVQMALPGGVGLAVLFELSHRYAARIDAARVEAFLEAEIEERRLRGEGRSEQQQDQKQEKGEEEQGEAPELAKSETQSTATTAATTTAPARMLSSLEAEEEVQGATSSSPSPSPSPSSSSWTAPLIDDETLERILSHWRRHFVPDMDSARGVGSLFLLLQLLITGCAVHIDLSMTAWRSTFFNVLQAKDVAGFHSQLWDFLPIAAASTLASVYDGYLTTMWDLRWREELVRDFVGLWLSDRSYLLASQRASEPDQLLASGSAFLGPSINIDNFDQRIVEDTGIFASSSRALICGALAAAMRLVVFGPALLRTAPNAGIWQLCLVLSVFSSLATHFVGHPLTARSAALQRAEADFRSSLMRLRLFAEEIAEREGEAEEEAAAARYFENIKAATWLAARGTLNLSVFTSVYGLAGGLLPFFVLVPSYFHGDISLGTMFQIEGIIGGVRQSLDFFVGAYGEIAIWRAATERLLALEAWVKQQELRGLVAPGMPAALAAALASPGQEGVPDEAEDVAEAMGTGASSGLAAVPAFGGGSEQEEEEEIIENEEQDGEARRL